MVLQRERLDQLVDGNDEHREMIARLEHTWFGMLSGAFVAGCPSI